MAGAAHSLGVWQPWSPQDVAQFFALLTVPWWIAGGWAIDLFLGRQTREHEDIDVQILRRDQRVVRALFGGWDMQAALPPPRDETWPFRPWRHGEVPGCSHSRHLVSSGRLRSRGRCNSCSPTRAMMSGSFAGRRLSSGQWLLSDASPTAGFPTWPLRFSCSTKRRGCVRKMKADFAQVLPALDQDRRQWLRNALALAHPGHPWLECLTGGSGV